ncbi:hypothetical protein ACIBI4_07130 [Streptomyces sp. NPDC050418]|uniref:hypothetical protein n=1 Tax=Streptomyces sp. NPDC050418 TaxID=3365612 RepID=UPI0037B2A42B
MHRTTRAALLVSLTVTAVSGCVAVKPTATPPATPSGPASAPAAKGNAEPQIVQAPAHEALQRIHEKERSAAEPSAPAGTRAPGAGPGSGGDSVRGSDTGAGQGPGTGSTRRQGRAPDTRPARPHAKPPAVIPGAGKSADLCGLGEQYGGWPADSPQAKTCREVYGG